MSKMKEILVFNPTEQEHASCSKHLASARFNNFKTRAVLTGPGKINATYTMAGEIQHMRYKGEDPLLVVGAGTAGSLDRHLKSGDLIISASSFISDWVMEDGDIYQHAMYGDLSYLPLCCETLEGLYICCEDEQVQKLLAAMRNKNMLAGNLMTSDTFVAGVQNKLERGEKFNCLACDMESGVFGFLANSKFSGLPWFNLRVVADTIEHGFDDYAEMEADMTEILAYGLVNSLETFDSMLDGDK